MFFQLQNVGSHEKKKCSELNRASATTAVTDCWQKRKPDKEGSTAGPDLFGNKMQMFRVAEKGMNAESDDQRCARVWGWYVVLVFYNETSCDIFAGYSSVGLSVY